ncbi:MAG TPA: ATP-binding protein [Bryobacteraceae bacterium]|nr:ATP-binding protein [Bryobacteraceae bacterium]
MKSVYAKISLFSFATLVISLIAFLAITEVVSFQNAHRTGSFGRIHSMELEQAREAYETGGVDRLRVFMERMHRYIPGRHFLTDAAGKDLLTGEDRSALIAVAEPEGTQPRRMHGVRVVISKSQDDRYRWIAEMKAPPLELQSYLPYYALILGAVALVCWLLAFNIATPLRGLARTVDRFGAGDLGVRVNSTRKDEIGELSRAFDRMAERIATLLSAERRLLQDISHELRSPLARLSFAAELVRTADDRDAAVARLRKEIHRLTDLVGALLQVTRAEGDPSAAGREDLRLDKLLEEVVQDCQMEAHARGCNIVCQASPPVLMSGDRELLRRAIENVVRNSIHYTPQGAAVDIAMDQEKDAVQISVRDYGPGVPDDALPKIFQPFFRVDGSRDSATGGMGLGLTIAKRAIGVHHGNVWARNAQPGLRVCIEVPLGAVEQIVART